MLKTNNIPIYNFSWKIRTSVKLVAVLHYAIHARTHAHALSHHALMHSCTHTHTHTQPFYGPFGFCPGQPEWVSTRKVKPQT